MGSGFSEKKPDASHGIKAFVAFGQENYPEVFSNSPAGGKAAPAWKSKKPEASEWKTKSASSGGYESKSSWKGKGSGSGKGWPGAIAPDNFTVSSGKKVLGGGKFADKTYAEVFEADPHYCQWLVNASVNESTQRIGWQWPFVTYVQNRWLDGGVPPPAPVHVTAQKGCLASVSIAITGTPSEMQRHVLEELIVFFGGRVVSSVTSKTTYVIVGNKHLGGQPPESGAKYSKAKQLNVPFLKVSDLLDDLEGTTEEPDQETFISGAHAQGSEHEHSE